VNYCQWVTNTPDCACAEWPCPHQTTCDRPGMNKWEGKWFCDEHYDDMLELEEQFEEHPTRGIGAVTSLGACQRMVGTASNSNGRTKRKL